MSSGPPTRRRFRSLAFRLNAWYVVAFLLSVGALAAFAIPTVRAAIERADEVVLEARVERHLAVLARGLDSYRTAVESSAALGDPEVPVRVRDPGGATVYQHGDPAASRVSVERVTGELRLEIGAPDVPWSAIADRLRPGGLALLLGTLALAVAGGYALTRRSLRPVRELASTARDVIRSGDLSRRVAVRNSGDELEEVSTLFNQVLARNQTLVTGMRESLDNVAHDLRTPLTRLRGTAELALRADDPAETREALGACIEESDHVLVMLRTLMDISEAEAGLMRLERTPTSLGTLVREVVELYEQVAEDAGVTLTAGAGEVEASVDPVRMRQAIANLVDNAVKYTPAGGTVTVDVEQHDARAEIRVRDTGPGIPEAALPRIFDRLFRAEPSRSKPGLGLGLSLVRAIATAHGGTVDVETSSAGSTFTLALPLSAPARDAA